jgi:glyoxylase-like metal-dependent hydrolase (beta-lactamase superfamily II)
MHEIHALQYGDGDAEISFLVAHKDPGQVRPVPTQSFLILGNPIGPILVDTGFRSAETIVSMGGYPPDVKEGEGLEPQLALHGLEVGDVALVVHTHAHVDHAGRTDAFPMSTPVVIARREVEVGAVGGPIYPAADIKHLIDRIHTPGAIKLLDVAHSGPVHIAPGIRCAHTGGHTDGSMSVLVQTDHGIANICGDVVYSIHDSIVEPFGQICLDEPTPSGNYTLPLIQEKAAIKRALEAGDWLLPCHDRPAKVDLGRVVGRVEGTVVPGPVTPVSAAPLAGVSTD